MTLVSNERGYFISYAGWGDNAIWGFNPATGEVDSAPVAAFSGGSGIATITADSYGKLWVGGNDTVTVLDPANGDQVEQVIHLGLNPTTDGIAFGTFE
jgi:streptogramin lyase